MLHKNKLIAKILLCMIIIQTIQLIFYINTFVETNTKGAEQANQINSNINELYSVETIINKNGIDVTERAKALVEIAYSYYLKGTNIQYDNSSFFRVNNWIMNNLDKNHKAAFYRGNYGDVVSEEATDQNTLYFVCSSFIYNTYKTAIGYNMLGDETGKETLVKDLLDENKIKESGITIVEEFEKRDQVLSQQDIEKIGNEIKVGDILAYNVGENTTDGHTMMYVGEINGKKMFVHCTGKAYDWTNKTEIKEEFTPNDKYYTSLGLDNLGAVCFTNLEHILTNFGKNKFKIIRPLDLIKSTNDYPVTDYAMHKLKYPGLEINKTSSINANITINPGDEIIYSTQIKNNSNETYKSSLKFNDSIPENTTFVEFVDNVDNEVTISNKDITGKIKLDAGEEKIISYKVKVNENCIDGEKIISDSTFISEIKAKDITIEVKNTLTKEQQSRLIEKCESQDSTNIATNVWIQNLYRDVLNIQVTIPTAQKILGDIFQQVDEPVEGTGQHRYMVKNNNSSLVSALYGGISIFSQTGDNATKEVKKDYLMNGDVIVYLDSGPIYVMYLYLNNSLYYIENSELEKISSESDVQSVLDSLIARYRFAIIRPSQSLKIKVKVEGVTLNKTQIEIQEGSTEKLIATVNPTESENKNVEWSSSDTSIATVDQNGTISAITPGEATITVMTEDGEKKATCKVTVMKKVETIPEQEEWDISKNQDGNVMARWSLKDKSLTITGTGEMKSWSYDSEEDWHNSLYSNVLKEIVIENGVTSIGSLAFSACTNLNRVIIPSTIKSIGENAFLNCNSETMFYVKSNSEALNYVQTNQHTYKIDDEAPKVEYTPDGGIIANEVTVTVTDNEANVGIDASSLRYKWTQSTTAPNADEFSESFTNGQTISKPTEEGTWYLWVYAEDNVGNSTKAHSEAFKNDRTPPTAQVKYSINKNNEKIKVTITANEPIQGIDGWTLSNEDKTLEREYANIVAEENITIKDKTGNPTEVKIEKEKEWDISVEQNGSLKAKLTINDRTLTISGTGEMKVYWDDWRVVPEEYKDVIEKIVIEEGVTNISDNAFSNCTNLTDVTISKGLNTIGYNAFANCSNLKEIKIPTSVTQIHDQAFANCTSLNKVIIPNSVTAIGQFTFLNCSQEAKFYVRSNSAGSNYASNSPYECILDDTKPTVEYTPNGGNTIKVTVTDNEENVGVDESSLKYVWTKSTAEPNASEFRNGFTNGETISKLEGEGTFYLWVYAEDNAGNITKAHSEAFKIDKTAPTVKYTSNGGNTANGVTVTVTDNNGGTGVKEDSLKYEWTQSTTAPNDFRNGFTNGETISKPEGEGTWYLWVYAEDNAGNSTTAHIEAFKVDKTAPTVTYMPNGGNTANGVKVTVTDNDGGTGVKADSLKYEWTQSTTAPNDFSNSFTNGETISKPTEEGIWYLWVYAEDNARNSTKEHSNAFENKKTPTTPTEPTIKKGDINQDGKIDTTDLIKMLRHISASKDSGTEQKNKEWILTEDKAEAADINGDGEINITDIVKMLRHIAAINDEETKENHPDWIIK